MKNEIIVETSEFDTKLFGVKTGKITLFAVSGDTREEIIKNAHALLEGAPIKKFKFTQCKIDSKDVYLLQALEKHGFFVTSVDLTFKKNLELIKKIKTSYAVVYCGEKDVEKLYEISKDMYTHTRFHNDPNVSKEKANEMQALWIKNCYKEKLADVIILVKEKEKICGYISCKKSKKTGRIILIGVDKGFRKKGIGSILINESFKWFKKQGCDSVLVGTQAHNYPAIKAYQKNGFEVESSTISLHKWQ